MLIEFRRRPRLIAVAFVLVVVVALAMAAALATMAGSDMILLPQGNDPVPSCESSDDVADFGLLCPSGLEDGDSVGSEPLDPVDLPPPSLHADASPEVVQ